MIIEYIRYAIDPSRNDQREAYRGTGALLDASRHGQVRAKATGVAR